jgi:lipopolysaccharide exporter
MKRAIAKGAVWMLLLRTAERSLGLVSIVILARLLVPADFGLVAMAMSVIAFVELGSSFGFELALIQREHPTRQHYDTAWTLQILFGAACALLLVALAYPSGWFYGDARLPLVMLVLSGGWLIQSLENIGVIEFRRQMNFAGEFAFLGIKRVVGFTVTLSLALLFQTYWALVAGMLAGRVTGVVLSYALQPYRPRWSLAARADLFSFSSWIFVVNLLGFASNRSSHFIVGRLHGSVALGLYTVGSEIAFLPVTDLIAPINRAVFPGYARTAGNPESLRQNFQDVIGLLAILALPASFGVAAVAEPLVNTMLGDKWAEAVILVQILALTGAFHAATSNHYSAWLALGRTGVVAFIGAVHVAFLLPLMLVLSQVLGVVGIAYAELSATVGSIIVECVMLCRALRLPMRSYLAGLWRPVIAATVMVFVVTVVRYELTRGSPTGSLIQLAVAVPIGAAVYASILILLWIAAGRPRSAEALIIERGVQAVVGLRRKTNA